MVTDVDIFTLFELGNKEKILLDLLAGGGPLIRIKYQEWQFFVLVFYPILFKQVIGNT